MDVPFIIFIPGNCLSSLIQANSIITWSALCLDLHTTQVLHYSSTIEDRDCLRLKESANRVSKMSKCDAPPAYSAIPTNEGGIYPEVASGQAQSVHQQVAYQPPGSSVFVIGQPQTTVVHVATAGLGPGPARIRCTNCGQDIVTTTSKTPGLLTYLAIGFCLLIGCWAGCCLIPCCVDSCLDTEHTCPNCKARLGAHKRIG